jgi:LacI family trehalose operon transcriptional repressor
MLQRRNIDGVVLFGFTGIKEEMLKPWQRRWCCWRAMPTVSPPSAMTTRARLLP